MIDEHRCRMVAQSFLNMIGPALGAARLARSGVGGSLVSDARSGVSALEVRPVAQLVDALAVKRQRYRQHLALR